MPSLHRRGLLQLSALALLGLAFDVPPPRTNPFPAARIGRALLSRVTVYVRPSAFARAAGQFLADDVVPILEEIAGDDVEARRNRWFRTYAGYIGSTNLQPVGYRLNRPLLERPATGQLLEVSVPWVDAYPRPESAGSPRYRLYFSTTHWTHESLRDRAGRVWYSLYDDRLDETDYARAEFLRPVSPRELAPISSRVPADRKRLEVDTDGQWMAAFEEETMVFRSPISSGARFVQANGEVADFHTPVGEFRIYRKRASRHMAAGDAAADDSYDLPGVPWVSYFSGAVAFHGTYWHNDFGFPRSHGCVNLPPDAARWVFRWSAPAPSVTERTVDGEGTRVIVK